ncbi:TMV resistance protein N-like [Quercus lobata]|uniref:TMV resistance protein N-like n=1 Tax=Quercus lobata TaxID=97700 RepID=UPI001243A1D8|nr:TMV resistance protein N-like [Quercus lobata]
MAQKTCSSSSSSIQTWSWDVFVALYRNGIRTFRDDREIETEEAIWTELEKAIVTSRIDVIVFSRNYAASSRCLKELEKIMECRRSLKQIGSLEKVFASHEERFGLDKVRRWRAALTEAANLCGEDLQDASHRQRGLGSCLVLEWVPQETLCRVFADDTLVLCDADLGQILFPRLVLFWFEVVSGLKINMVKSELVPVGVVPNIADMVDVLGCKQGSLLAKYLGLPLGANVRNRSIWNPIIEKMERSFESTFMEEIIKDIFNKLDLAYFRVATYPVGIESRLQGLDRLLSRDSGDVCMVGILGIGGMGKTTMAKAIYNLLHSEFEESCFLGDVRETAKQPDGLIKLQKKILSSVQVNDGRKISHVDQGTMVIKERVWSKRVLLVLDDVDHQEQLDKLAVRRNYFQPGSRIIITMRNESLLNLFEVDERYMPPKLNHHESLLLFSWHAFRKDQPNEDFEELSKEVVGYAERLPLALEVLGSLLSDKKKSEWESALQRLKVTIPCKIQEKLKE